MDKLLTFSIIILFLMIIYKDINEMIIPNILNITLFIIAIFYKGFNYEIIESSILGMGSYSLPLILIYGYLSDFLEKDILGFGDIKLTLNLGYILGYQNFYTIYIFYMVMFISTSLIGCLIGVKRKTFKYYLPFSPFIILSFIIIWVKVI